MSTNQELEVEFDYDDFHVVATGIYIIDPDYGADADGNRGIELSWVEDINIEVYKDNKKLKNAWEYFDAVEWKEIERKSEDLLNIEGEKGGNW